MRLYIALLSILLLIDPLSGASAQESREFLPPVEPITLSNVERLQELAVIGGGTVDQISLSPDGDQLAVINRLGIDIYDLTHPDTRPRKIATEFLPIINALVHPDWLWVVISTPQTLSIIDLETGSLIRELRSADQVPVPAIHFIANEMVLSADSRWLGETRGRDGGQATVWDTQTGEMLYSQDHRYMVGSPLFSSDNRAFAYAYYENSPDFSPTPSFWYGIDTQNWDFFVALHTETDFGRFKFIGVGWDAPERGPFVTTNPTIRAQAGGDVLVSLDRSGATRVWDSSTGNELFQFPANYQFYTFSADGRLVIFDHTSQELRLIEPFTQMEETVRTGERELLGIVINQNIATLNLPVGIAIPSITDFYNQNEMLANRYWIPDYSQFAEITDEGNVLLPGGYIIEPTSRRIFESIWWSPDGTKIATVERIEQDYTFDIRVWQVADASLLDIITSGMFGFRGLVWSLDGTQLAVMLEHPTGTEIYSRGLRVFGIARDVNEGFNQHSFQVFRDVNIDYVSQQTIAAWSQNGTMLAVVLPGASNSLNIYRLDQIEPLISLPTAQMTDLEWSVDNRFIVGDSEDGTLRIWGVPSTE